MPSRIVWWVAVAVALALAAGCDRGGKQADVAVETPGADEVLEAYVTAIGGREAFAKVDALRVDARFELKQQGVRGTMMVVQQRPNLSYSRMWMASMGTTEDGCDGTRCWKTSGDGVQLLSGEELAEELRESVLDSDLRWRELYTKVEVAGGADFEGRPAWKVVYTPSSGPVETKYFDRTTKLMLGEDTTGGGRMRVHEWGMYADIKQPRTLSVSREGMEMQIDVVDIEVNPTLDPAMFVMPARPAEAPAEAPAAEK